MWSHDAEINAKGQLAPEPFLYIMYIYSHNQIHADLRGKKNSVTDNNCDR